MKLNDIEFRFSEGCNTYELIKWSAGYCYVIAFFYRNDEGYDMRTIGERFFEDRDAWIVGKHALAFLNEIMAEGADGDAKKRIRDS